MVATNLVTLHSGKNLFHFGDGNFDSYSILWSIAYPADSNPAPAPPTSAPNQLRIQGTCFSIGRYDYREGKWQQSYPFFNRAAGVKFEISPDEAYLLYLNQNKEKVWLPSQVLK